MQCAQGASSVHLKREPAPGEWWYMYIFRSRLRGVRRACVWGVGDAALDRVSWLWLLLCFASRKGRRMRLRLRQRRAERVFRGAA